MDLTSTSLKSSLNINVRMEPRPVCYLCGGKGSTLYIGLIDKLLMLQGKWDFSFCEKADCGLAWLNPFPVKEDIGLLYDTYYTHQANAKPKNNFHPIFLFIDPIYSSLKLIFRIRWNRRQQRTLLLPSVKSGELLEVGCGDGGRLKWFQEKGWSVTGQEIDPKAVEYAQTQSALKIHHGDLCKLDLEPESFDAIVMSHVIEHLPEPDDQITECRRLLKPGGQLMVATPNIQSYGHLKYGQHWSGLGPPHHLYLYSAPALSNLLKRSKFKEVSCITSSSRAEVFAKASLALKRQGYYIKDEALSPGHRILAMLFQIKASLHHLSQPLSGEEIIATGIK